MDTVAPVVRLPKITTRFARPTDPPPPTTKPADERFDPPLSLFEDRLSELYRELGF